MNAFQQGLDAKPAEPSGFPPGRTITFSGQVAAHLGHSLPEGSCGHQRGSLNDLCCHNGEQVRIEDLVRRTLRIATGKIAQLRASAPPEATRNRASGSNDQRSAPGGLRDDSQF